MAITITTMTTMMMTWLCPHLPLLCRALLAGPFFTRQNDAHQERMFTSSAATAATALAGGRLNGRNPMLQRPRERTPVDRRTRLHTDLLQEPEERPVLHQANSTPLSDSRGESTTGALSPISCIASRSAKGFAHCKLSGPSQAYENRNLLPAGLLLRLLLSGRLAGRSWLPALL